ncbi:hypothetical protein BYT27DRAFT_7258970 [Phlegmacium glaucopus]|nr:hypothetical protein BYT27DRAFT_7258970 [Phlegmacium glaucopus]
MSMQLQQVCYGPTQHTLQTLEHSRFGLVTFGNQSKYARGKPSQPAAHHLAYIPLLPEMLQDEYMAIFGDAASAPTMAHLKHELMHPIWELLLDVKFMDAYEHGIVLKCADGAIWRIYRCFFTYAADYPEKVLLSTIQYLANRPCSLRIHCLSEHGDPRSTVVDVLG